MKTNVRVFSGKTDHQCYKFASAINKYPLGTAMEITPLGLSGDEQADQRYHGGVERALHYYPNEHYDYWQNRFPGNALFAGSGFGENLSGTGLTEANTRVGDIFRLGQALVQVSQPRSPCFKLNARFAVNNFSLLMQQTGFSGWFFRVLEPGLVAPEDSLVLLESPCADITLERVLKLAYLDPLNQQELEVIQNCALLADSWRDKVKKRLETGFVEDWNKRLFGPLSMH